MDALSSSLEQPIAFYPVLKRITKSTTAALLLSYFIQHCKTAQTSEKFHKTQKEIESATGLSRTEQESARKTLKALGLLKEERTGLPCKLYFEVSVETLCKLTSDDSLLALLKPHYLSSAQEHTNPENLKNTQILQFAETLQTSMQDSCTQVCSNPAHKFVESLQSSMQESCNQVCTNPANNEDMDNGMDNENLQKHANFAVCRSPANKFVESPQTSLQESCNQVCSNPADYARTRAHARAYTCTLSNNKESTYQESTEGKTYQESTGSKDNLTWYYHESTGGTTIVEVSLSSPSLYLQKSSVPSPSLPKAFFEKNAFGMDASEKKFSRSETFGALVPNNVASSESVAGGEDGDESCGSNKSCGDHRDPVQDSAKAQPELNPESEETHSNAESGTLDEGDKAIGGEVVVEFDHSCLNDLSCESETMQNTGGGRAADALQSDGRAGAAENAHKSLIAHELFEDIPNIVPAEENAPESLKTALKQKRGAGRKAKSEEEPKKARKTRSKGETEEEKAFRQEFFAFATKVVDWIVSRGGVKEDPACFYRWARKLARSDKRITVEVIRACFRHYAMQTNGYGWRGKIKTFKQFMYAFNEIYQHYQTSLNILQNQNLNGGHHDLSTSRSEQSPQPAQGGIGESTTAIARRDSTAGTGGNSESAQLLGDINTAGYDYLEWREKYERDLREYEQKLRVSRELLNSKEFTERFTKW